MPRLISVLLANADEGSSGKPPPLDTGHAAWLRRGIQERDEAYLLKYAKGQPGLPRKAWKRGGKASTRGTSKNIYPVLFVGDRAGNTANFALNTTTAEEFSDVLKPILPVDTVLCADGSGALASAAHDPGVERQPINVASGIRVVGAWLVQDVHAFGNRLRRGMTRFKEMSGRHLENHLGWFPALDRSPGFHPEPASLLVFALKPRGRHQHAREEPILSPRIIAPCTSNSKQARKTGASPSWPPPPSA